MNEQNIQHPDITSAERTGYPRKRMVTLDITDKMIRNYIWEEKTEFIDFCIQDGAIIDQFLALMRDDFEDWCHVTLTEG